MEPKIIIKVTGGVDDLEMLLDHIGLSADTYDRVLIEAQKIMDTKFPCFINIVNDATNGFSLFVSENAKGVSEDKFIDLETMVCDLRLEKRRLGIADLQAKCRYYMGYCDLCPYNSACQKISAVYRGRK